GANHPRIRAEWYAPMELGIMGAWRCYNRYAPMGLEGEMSNALHESKQHEPYLKLSHYLIMTIRRPAFP
ncbi:MAG: hypothetical protein JWQ98_3397, partial [Chlorobi bacterium]|nr:hypothetical protein [Chlorobiota bacterium]